MKQRRIVHILTGLVTGAVLLQTNGCTTQEFIVFLQTVFLGITAAGAIAILENT